jgi:hypothetical protein
MMLKEKILKKAADYLPGNLRPLARSLYYRGKHWAHPALKGFGTVQDLYYWVADGDLDTLLVLQNYFSVLYPGLDTATEGTLSLYSNGGETLGGKSFSVAHCGAARFRVSSLLEELAVSTGETFGTLEVHLAIPVDVLNHIQEQKALYFWDRFYIGYVNGQGQTCFVHGVDKTHIYREGNSGPVYWYKEPKGHQWAPEIPVDIDSYKKFNVIMINRTSRGTTVTLTLSDTQDNSLSWNARVPPQGVHRFELTPENTAGLEPRELRMRVKGMASQYGRPVVFKEFRNGAISAMHC